MLYFIFSSKKQQSADGDLSFISSANFWKFLRSFSTHVMSGFYVTQGDDLDLFTTDNYYTYKLVIGYYSRYRWIIPRALKMKTTGMKD